MYCVVFTLIRGLDYSRLPVSSPLFLSVCVCVCVYRYIYIYGIIPYLGPVFIWMTFFIKTVDCYFRA